MNAAPQDRWRPWTAPAALLAAVGVTLVAQVIVALLAKGLTGASLTNPPGWVTVVASVIQDLTFVAVAVWFASMVARPTPEQFGLRPTPWRRGAALVAGSYIFFVVITAVWSWALDLNAKEKVLDELGANTSTAALVVVAAFTCVMAPICEELFFRGYFFRALRNWHGVWPAALLTGLVFGGVHAGSAPVGDLVPLAALGVILCLLYERTGSLYLCIALHVLNNAIAFGGTESWSVAGIAVLAVAALAAAGGTMVAIARVADGQ